MRQSWHMFVTVNATGSGFNPHSRKAIIYSGNGVSEHWVSSAYHAVCGIQRAADLIDYFKTKAGRILN